MNLAKVESKSTLRLLTKRFIKENRGRNIMAITSIMLTTLLLTAVFTGSSSMILSKKAADIRQNMCSAHASAQELTAKQAPKILEALANNKEVERYGTGIFLGNVMGQFGFSTEVRYGDENMVESYQCMPTTGRLPQKPDEIAVSTLVLDALELPYEIGEEVTLTYDVNWAAGETETKTDTFRLCGYWEGDKALMSQIVWVCESYAMENRHPVSKKEIKNGIYNGSWDFCVWYHSPWNLSSKTKELSVQTGITGKSPVFKENPAYIMFDEEVFSISSLIIFISIIILAGYLIIYNVFSISVNMELRAYALLKNIGTTGKQLRKIVRMQALLLCTIGIPLGLVIGFGIGVCIAPLLVDTNGLQDSKVILSAHPLIFVAAALFSLFTVYLSCFQACRKVEKVSPIEAMRLSSDRHSFKKTKKNFSISWFSMLLQNRMRNFTKGVIVMLSIALSLIVMNCIVILTRGFHFQEYLDSYISADFQISRLSSNLNTTNFYGVGEKVKKILESSPYTESNGYLYYAQASHTMGDSMYKACEQLYENYLDYWTDYFTEIWKEAFETGTIRVHYMGMNRAMFEKLEWRNSPCSWEEFQTGKMAVIDYPNFFGYEEENLSYYFSGASLSVQYQNGEEKTYQVLEEACIPYPLDYPYSDAGYITVMVPESEFISTTGENAAMVAAVDAKQGKEKNLKTYINTELLEKEPVIFVKSALDLLDSLQKDVEKYYIVGGLLTAVLAFIGIMNFFNITATSLLSRKKDLALLETMGMTKKQIQKMLIAEGCFYLIGAYCIAIIVILFASEKLLEKTVGLYFYFHMELTLLPCLFMLPILLLIAGGIPVLLYRNISKKSLAERI